MPWRQSTETETADKEKESTSNEKTDDEIAGDNIDNEAAEDVEQIEDQHEENVKNDRPGRQRRLPSHIRDYILSQYWNWMKHKH